MHVSHFVYGGALNFLFNVCLLVGRIALTLSPCSSYRCPHSPPKLSNVTLGLSLVESGFVKYCIGTANAVVKLILMQSAVVVLWVLCDDVMTCIDSNSSFVLPLSTYLVQQVEHNNVTLN